MSSLHLRIVKIGKISKDYQQLAEKFFTLLQPNKLEVIELKGSKKGDKQAAMLDEAELLQAKIQPDWPTFILSEYDKHQDSQQFAAWLDNATAQSGRLQLVIGGAFGLPESFRQQYKQLSLSSLTFPHDLAFVVLLEQIYRAITIINGKTYHY